MPIYKEFLTYKYGEDKNEDTTRKMKISLFTMIVGSEDPRGAVILDGAIKSDNKAMRKMGLFLRETLIKREREKEGKEVIGKPRAPVAIAPSIMDVSTGTVGKLKVVLCDIMVDSSLEVRLQVLKQLRKQGSYLKSKKGRAKRVVITKILKDYYKTEKKPAIQEAIIGTLLDIGKEKEVRPFFKKIARDKKASQLLRKNAQIAIQMLDAERAKQKK